MQSDRDVILVISSNSSYAHSLKQMLSDNGYSVTLASGEPLRFQSENAVSLAIVDRQSASLKSIRQYPSMQKIPLLALHQPGSVCREEDCIDDFDAGADAWLCSGSNRELLARIRAISRRSKFVAALASRIQAGGIEIDLERHEVRIYNRVVQLTLTEFKILSQFVRAPNRILSREELLNRVWGEDRALEEHALDVHIHSLRNKIEPNRSQPIFIVTVRKVGFKLLST